MFRPYRASSGASIYETKIFPELLHILINIRQISKRENINYKYPDLIIKTKVVKIYPCLK